MQEYGYTIEATLITTIDPNKEVKASMNKINATARLTEAITNEAQANYIKEIRQAEADRDRKRLLGEGISQQRLAILQGFEQGIDQMAKKFNLSPAEILEFVRNIQELDTMERIGQSENTKVLFFERNSRNLRQDIIQAQEAEK